MQILSEDGAFGISLTPAQSRSFFVFKVKVGEEWLGDDSPAIEWTSVSALSRLRSVDDPRLDPGSNDPDAILRLLTSADEPELNDRTLIQFGEALDRYTTRSYFWRDDAVFLFREVEESPGTLMGRMSRGELLAIAAAAGAAHAAFDAIR